MAVLQGGLMWSPNVDLDLDLDDESIQTSTAIVYVYVDAHVYDHVDCHLSNSAAAFASGRACQALGPAGRAPREKALTPAEGTQTSAAVPGG